jgi:endonuclease/exonuclease/phosphatase family metal-dependent hydrolase
MKTILLLLLFLTTLFGDTLKIATYNVENLFDLKKSGYEYKEYIPFTRSNWNRRTYAIKLHNTAKVIKDINADIIALEEVESFQALKDLRYTLKRMGLYYPYYKIANKKNTTVKVAILSKIPFVYTKEIAVTQSYKYRNILEVKFKLKNEYLYLLINHWKSKTGPESMRIISAKKVRQRIKELGEKSNIIVLGDFNSDYEENKHFKRKRKLNNTHGITGINTILGTQRYQYSASNKIKIHTPDLYNLWYDQVNKDERYTHIFRRKKEALDNILVSNALLDHKGIEYIRGSIHSFQRNYLFKGRGLYRWQMSWSKPKRHYGKGYSDHLPVVAEFHY